MNISRIDLYEYIKGFFVGESNTIFNNIHYGEIPQILTDSDSKHGFVVIRLGTMDDNSEIALNTYVTLRCYIECYMPLYNGTVNTTKYKKVQEAVDSVIKRECSKVNAQYNINTDSLLSADGYFNNNNNSSFGYIASFQITIT